MRAQYRVCVYWVMYIWLIIIFLYILLLKQMKRMICVRKRLIFEIQGIITVMTINDFKFVIQIITTYFVLFYFSYLEKNQWLAIFS